MRYTFFLYYFTGSCSHLIVNIWLQSIFIFQMFFDISPADVVDDDTEKQSEVELVSVGD